MTFLYLIKYKQSVAIFINIQGANLLKNIHSNAENALLVCLLINFPLHFKIPASWLRTHLP